MSLSFETDLSGKIVVVTGAGGVLCGMFAKAIVETGAKVAVLDLNEETTGKVADEIVTAGEIAKAYKTSTPERAGLGKAHAKMLAELGPCDILINGVGDNNARVNTTKEHLEIGDIETDTVSFFDLDQSDVEFVFSLSFIGTLLPTQIFTRGMVERKGRTTSNVSSMNTFTPLIKIPVYSGAETAISNLIQRLAMHFSKVGIHVNTMALGFFMTEQNKKPLFNEDGTPTERTTEILAATPMERFGEAKGLNGTLLYLLDNEASGFVTSMVIPVDSGLSVYSRV